MMGMNLEIDCVKDPLRQGVLGKDALSLLFSMNYSPLRIMRDFLSLQWKKGAPLVVGCSGGVDSLALLHLLITTKRWFDLDLHVLHIDHGWTSTSAAEAEELREYVGRLHLPFYLYRLSNTSPKENISREGRFRCFQQLHRKLKYQALLLAHQANDQSETVLKRVLEGASLYALGGIKPISHVRGIPLWRPLLGVKKSTLKKWLDRHHITPKEDLSNQNPCYLRARIRTQIIPTLEEQFGKKVENNLSKLGFVIQELIPYLEKKAQEMEFLVQEDEDKVWIDLSSRDFLEFFEIKLLIVSFMKKQQLRLSYSTLQNLCFLLKNGSASCKKLKIQDRWVEIRKYSIAIKKNKAYL